MNVYNIVLLIIFSEYELEMHEWMKPEKDITGWGKIGK